ncbi:MAG: c-type cytochrome biogenesis protein CcmI [Gammaproteobacteria bacterium]
MSFWVSLAALAALAAVCLLWPLRRVAHDSPAGEDDQLRRLREFEQELAAGDIDPAVAPALRAELERAVVTALPTPAAVPAGTRGRAALVMLCLATPVFALGLYWQFGSPDVARFAAEQPGRDWRKPETSVEYLVARVLERVASHPDDAEAWSLLARTEMQLGHFAEAQRAARELNRVLPNNPDAMLVLVDSLAITGDAEQRKQALALTAQVLAVAPRHPTALVMKGMFQLQDGQRDAALATWQEAHGLAGEVPGLRQEIETLVAHAGGSLTPATDAATRPAAKVRVKARIKLSPELAARARPGDALFVAARGVEGPPMPLAVSRHTVAELPLELTLDENMAMVPGHSLADVARFYLVARISQGGSANAQAGDLEGKSAEMAVADGAQVDITIDHVLP